jgi:CubicO group peptidase (beta-lactamase class C family)
VGAAQILVARNGQIVLHEAYGRLSPDASAPAVKTDSVFLLASITKPVTACALMLMVERGKVKLDDPVNRYLPEFTGGERGKILVRDLLRHTSGLPDMLPENIDLRRVNAPLSDFVQHTFKTPLLFSPNTECRYQSMGILLAAEIVERTAGMRLRDFEKREIFDPLGMKASSLGLGGRRIADLVRCGSSPNANPADEASFGPNSPYWRDFGCPWGGMHSNTRDVATLLQTFLDGGTFADRRIFSATTVQAMISDQNQAIGTPWGLGWALGRSKSWNAFGEGVSPTAFGHAGATGTVAWADPRTRVVCVILTNRPYALDDGKLLRAVSTAVAGAVGDVKQ